MASVQLWKKDCKSRRVASQFARDSVAQKRFGQDEYIFSNIDFASSWNNNEGSMMVSVIYDVRLQIQ